jgi:hypothetical protein
MKQSRGDASPLLSETLQWIDNLGRNRGRSIHGRHNYLS